MHGLARCVLQTKQRTCKQKTTSVFSWIAAAEETWTVDDKACVCLDRAQPCLTIVNRAEADLDPFPTHSSLDIVLESFIDHLRYVLAIFSFGAQADQ